MGKTRDLLKKIRYQGNNSCKDGHNKGQKWYGLTEAEDIKKWQEYTEELYKKDHHDPDNHDGVITHLEPAILECEVKWALQIAEKRNKRQKREGKIYPSKCRVSKTSKER